jgi:transposase
MAKPLLPDALWAIIKPLLPTHAPSPKGGRPRLDDRKALTGILFVLKTGLPWEDLPAEMNCGCGMSCWRRLAEWQADGTWDRIHAVLLERLQNAGKLDWSKCVIDSSSVRAVLGGWIPDRTRPTGARRAASTT